MAEWEEPRHSGPLMCATVTHFLPLCNTFLHFRGRNRPQDARRGAPAIPVLEAESAVGRRWVPGGAGAGQCGCSRATCTRPCSSGPALQRFLQARARLYGRSAASRAAPRRGPRPRAAAPTAPAADATTSWIFGAARAASLLDAPAASEPRARAPERPASPPAARRARLARSSAPLSACTSGQRRPRGIAVERALERHAEARPRSAAVRHSRASGPPVRSAHRAERRRQRQAGLHRHPQQVEHRRQLAPHRARARARRAAREPQVRREEAGRRPEHERRSSPSRPGAAAAISRPAGRPPPRAASLTAITSRTPSPPGAPAAARRAARSPARQRTRPQRPPSAGGEQARAPEPRPAAPLRARAGPSPATAERRRDEGQRRGHASTRASRWIRTAPRPPAARARGRRARA